MATFAAADGGIAPGFHLGSSYRSVRFSARAGAANAFSSRYALESHKPRSVCTRAISPRWRLV